MPRKSVTVTRSGPRSGQDHRGLGPLESGVDRHQDGAGGEHAEGGHRPLGAVAAPDRYAVAGLDPGGDQRGPELAGGLVQLRVGKLRPPVAHRHRSANCSAARAEHGGEEGQTARPAPSSPAESTGSHPL